MMFQFLKKRKEKQIEEAIDKAIKGKVDSLNQTKSQDTLVESLDQNINMIKKLFKDVDIMKYRYFGNNYNSDLKYCIIFCDGVVNSNIMNDNIIRPLMLSNAASEGSNLMDSLIRDVIMINEIVKTADIKKIIEAVTYGDTVLFAEGAAEAILLNTKGFALRAIAEPENEKTLSGPRDGFNESLLQNLSLIQRKVRTNNLKLKFYSLGRVTKTQVCLCYVDGIVNKEALKELIRQLGNIDMDAVLDSNYITELIRDSKLSPFRTTGYTERPDVVVGKILEGRIAIVVDGTPTVITVPYLFIENFQSSEDYYLSFYYTSFSRMLRMLGFIFTISIPGMYISIVAFHIEMLPTDLLINIAKERSSVPLPAAIEAVILLLIFDILRETGVRMPTNIGQALSIVGALVIGQAAVEAQLVAAPMIIVVAFTGITGLLVPKMNAPVIYIRILLLALGSSFGFYGLVLGFSAVLVHVINLKSLGLSQLSASGSLKFQDIKDTFFRAPWWKMVTRPTKLSEDKVRMKVDKGGSGGSHD